MDHRAIDDSTTEDRTIEDRTIDGAALLAELAAALPQGAVVTDPDILAAHVRDHADLCEAGAPLALVRPRDTAQVAAVMRAAHAHGVPVVPQGARTGLAGAANAVDGCLLLSLAGMNAILELDPVNRLAVVQPGVINADVSRAAQEHGLRYVPDPGSWESSTIGGNVATNAGGMRCVKYGVTSEYVLALEVVLADGRVMRCGRRTAKGVAGYDLVRLFTGSEGTLGVITEITLKLSPIPAGALTLVAAFPSTTAAGEAVTAITAAGLVPSLLELIDNVHLRAIEDLAPQGLPVDAAALLLAGSDSGELDGIAAICESSGATEVFAATDATEADMLMTSRRLAYTAMEKLGAVIVDDIAVPRSRLAEALDGVAAIAAKHEVLIGVIAHAGDGNLHPNIVVDREDPSSVERGRAAFDEIMAMCLEMGGTSTGEHGVGLLKREWLAREVDEVNMSVQRALKDALDPTGVLNPGKVL
nr:FAD-linked oxidase C-terminal domain-containing protein [Actinorhabdospora filicis]